MTEYSTSSLSPAGKWWITTGGLGFMRPASGTWGSLPPCVVAATLLHFGQAGWTYDIVMTGLMVTFGVACVVLGDAAEARFGRKDPGQVVADETCGMCIPLLGLDERVLHQPLPALGSIGFAFLAFRFLDIVKPWPARGLQSVPGGWGILLDDLVAGLYAAVAMQVVSRMWVVPWVAGS
ncbi:MAG: phosphatidylglycerophosphatase A [Phycisphaerae bacterium]|nr:phosphatidylglycerophosphatase A [Phycisphaerae bacterium]